MRRWLAALAASCSCAAMAEDDPRWYLQIDNDVVFTTDRWYTSGVRLARVKREGDRAIEWGLEQQVWTPESERFQPGVVDRAPTARLRGSFALHEQSAQLFQTIEVALGARGAGALGERTTSAIHKIVSAPEVDWSREVSTRVDASVGVARTHTFGPAAVHYGGVLGNEVSFAHAGAELRAGNGGQAFSPMLRHVATPPFQVNGSSPAAGVNGFVGVDLRWVPHNRLLDLPYEAGGPAPTRKDFVGRFAGGLTAVHLWGSVVFASVQDTREFDEQRQPHRFGSLLLHIPF